MKKILFLLSFLIMALVAFAQKPETKKIDLKAEQTAVNALMNKLTMAFKDQDAATLVSLLCDDVFVLGSDPSEFFNKKQTTDIWTEMFAQPFAFDFTVEAIIKVAPDGNSAFAIHQYFMPAYSDKIQFRNSYHLIKLDNQWKIFAMNTACIPTNDDFLKMNESLNSR